MLFDTQQQLVSRACFREQDGSFNTVWATHYAYDADGLLQDVRDTELGPIRYEYDADLRVIGQHGPGALKFDYRYDLAGNLSFTPSHLDVERGADNLLKHSHNEHFEYDERYRLAKRVRADGSEVRYHYDSADQLVEARFSDRNQVWRAAYDGLGRRLWREYGGARTNFYWDKDRLAGETAPDGSLRVYVYANEDVLVPFMWLDYSSVDADPTSGVARYLFCAPTGMPLRVEDASGHVVWQADAIEPYGRSGAQAFPVRLRFAGHFYDEDLELFYNRFRDYDPGLCRYLQPDPLGHAGGTNLYAYPANPAAAVDLRGLVHKAKKPAAEDGEQGEDKKPEKKPKEPLEELEVGSYRAQNKKDAEGVGMDRDHIPSKAAVKKAMEDAGLEVKPTTVDGNLTSVAIDRETHKEGRTYGNKNDDAQVAADAKDLRAAADKDLAEHRKALEGRDPPVPPEKIDAMEAAVHKRNEELGLYDKPIDPVKLQKLNKPMKD
jgi:RHS repeat-associated protein